MLKEDVLDETCSSQLFKTYLDEYQSTFLVSLFVVEAIISVIQCLLAVLAGFGDFERGLVGYREK